MYPSNTTAVERMDFTNCVQSSLNYTSLPERDVSFLGSYDQAIPCNIQTPFKLGDGGKSVRFKLPNVPGMLMDFLQSWLYLESKLEYDDETQITKDESVCPVSCPLMSLVSSMEVLLFNY